MLSCKHFLKKNKNKDKNFGSGVFCFFCFSICANMPNCHQKEITIKKRTEHRSLVSRLTAIFVNACVLTYMCECVRAPVSSGHFLFIVLHNVDFLPMTAVPVVPTIIYACIRAVDQELDKE